MFENFTVRLCRDRFDHSLRHAFLLQPKLKAQLQKQCMVKTFMKAMIIIPTLGETNCES